MAEPHKLQKPMLLALIGKSPESEEFKTILNVLGEPEEINTFEGNLLYYTWKSKGVDISFVDNRMDGVILFIEPNKDYPHSARAYTYYDDWDYDFTAQELINFYGEPTRKKEAQGYSYLIESETTNVMTYQDDRYRITYSFTSTDWDTVTRIDIGEPIEFIDW